MLAGHNGNLERLRPAILAVQQPLTVGRWLARSRELLTALNEGRVPLEHETLDQLPHPKAAEYLR
ncbi:hypothetical protein B7R22_06730 [Subtercola boreus]|uniref:Uncharacterized protein n=1 Tax=Subtercola boreus TaxID=120213 RepID=A0A3E0W1R1_9MICO|nr:hypothetical protein [Subtercola boreus]RFA15518.1 hypothetical protein B7R22_06730 [Subtercola boreus]